MPQKMSGTVHRRGKRSNGALSQAMASLFLISGCNNDLFWSLIHCPLTFRVLFSCLSPTPRHFPEPTDWIMVEWTLFDFLGDCSFDGVTKSAKAVEKVFQPLCTAAYSSISHKKSSKFPLVKSNITRIRVSQNGPSNWQRNSLLADHQFIW